MEFRWFCQSIRTTFQHFVQEVARMESPVLEHVMWPFYCTDVEGYGLDATVVDCSCQRRLSRLIDEFVDPSQSKCISLTRTWLHLFHRVFTGQVTFVVIESTVDSDNISRDSSKKWRGRNQLCWNTLCDLFCVEECGLHATVLWVLRVFL